MKVAVIVVACLLQILSSGVVHGANPNYSYHVKIDDPSHVNFQEKAETRKGEDAQGFYSVLEPNGALRTVSYIADERGFNPIVSYSYGHPQSSVTVTSAAGPAAIVKQPGVYAPAYVSDSRVQIVDKSNIYAAPPPALNLQTFNLPGPSAPVVVPAPLRQVAPVVKASAAIAANYAPAFVPPPEAYLPPPTQVLVQQPQVVAVAQPQRQVFVQQPQVVVRKQPQVIVRQQPQVIVRQQPQVIVRQQPQVIVRQPQVVAVPQPQVLAVPQPQVLAVPQPQVIVQQQPAIQVTKVVQPSKFLTVPAAKVVKTVPAVAAVIKDSYSEAPRDTFRDPSAPSYPDAIKVTEPVADYGPPAYLPPPVVTEVAPVKVVQPVVQQVAIPVPPPAIAVQKVVAAPPPAIAVQKFVAAPPPVIQYQQQVVAAPPPAVAVQTAVNPGLYAGAVGFHTHTTNPASYVHSYGTQGFQVTSSRQFNKGFISAPKLVRGPTAVYSPPPVAIAQKVVQAPVYGPPAVAVAPPPPVRVVAPRPVYGPPPVKVVQQVQVAAPPPPPVVQNFVSAPVALPPPAPVAIAAPIPAVAAAPVAIAGKKQNPLTFAYSYDQGGAKVTHSYSGSGW